MESLEWKHLHVDYMCEKIQVQKTHTKNDIPNLPIGVVVRNKEENHLITLTPSLGLSICCFNMKFFTRVIKLKISCPYTSPAPKNDIPCWTLLYSNFNETNSIAISEQ